MKSNHRQYLYQLSADETPHSGRSLFEHLKGVHDLLRDWDNTEDVCVAGLFHSIYGTNTFKHVSTTNRVELTELIGDKAEMLVHYFSTRKRPFFNDLPKGEVRNQLREIEVANLIEQGGSKKTLNKLARLNISNGAKAAIAMGAHDG